MPGKTVGVVAQEPPMYLQRPSTGRSQDVRHILARTFRQLYTRDAIRPETVKNLQVSKGGDDPYHERYVESLQKVYEEWQRRMDEAAMLERHIMQAQARGMSADERDLNRTSQSCDQYSELGLPPGRSHFRSCIDTELLKKHNLLTPEDYATDEPLSVPPPEAPVIPSYARDTLTSQQHSRRNETREETPLPFIADAKASMEFPSFISDEDLESDGVPFDPNADKFPKTDDWKHHMNEDQREAERHDLANLQAKINYLRNPRHVPPSEGPGSRTLLKSQKKRPKQIGIEEKQEKVKSKEPSLIFLASPPVVTFRDYKVEQVYEIVLELKNITTVLRPCRVLPPSTPYFSIGLGQFPGEHGVVAPGMSCKYPIRFIPDSLKDFDDELVVQTQSSKPLVIPIQGRREPPSLTFPSMMDVGYCLVGGYQVTQFVVRNDGGPGRFCMMSRATWPAINFKSVVTNGTIPLPPFEIRPSTFELLKGQSGVVEVIFNPQSDKMFTQDLTVVCDNCQVQHLCMKGEGQLAKLDLQLVERGLSEHVPGECCDISAKNLIRFDNLNPYTYTERSIIVKNCSNVELPFQWMVYKPQLKHVEAEPAESSEPPHLHDRVPDMDSAFSVHPPNGVLNPAEVRDFKITFAPPVLNEFHSVLHMMLQQVPSTSESMRSITEQSEGSQRDEDRLSEIYMSNDITQYKDATGMQIEVKGKSVPLNVVLHPYAMYIPGHQLVGTTIKKVFTMANHSFSTITFQWQPHNDKHIIEVEPPFGELDPGMAMDLELAVTGVEPCKISHTLFCYVLNMDEPLALHVEAEIKGPKITIEEPDVNFGLVRYGQTVEREITLCNQSQVKTRWCLQDSPTVPVSDDPMVESEFEFFPDSGDLKPLESKKIVIKFKPTAVKTVKRVFEVEVEDGEKCSIGAFAEVQSPTVCLLECEITLPEVYVGVPSQCQAILHNQGLLPTEFIWGEVEGSHANDCSIEIDPKSGILAPREERSITVGFCAKREGEFSEVRIPCEIQGMATPLHLNLSCDVKGLSVTFKTSSDGITKSNELHLNFGENVELGTTPNRFLYVKNESAITAPYSINVEYFTAKPPMPPETKADQPLRSQRKMLGRTPNLADPFSRTTSKAQADLCKAMLSQGQGAAFVINPCSGFLPPFGEDICEITAYSDLWGEYTDRLVVMIGDLEPSYIPITMTVVGCPLTFQMTAAKPEQKPVVRFGTHVSGVAAINRSMRVNNTSPHNIRLDWQVFDIVPDDTKLLDLNVCFGRPFPVRDSLGNEIPPTEDAPLPLKRCPTEYIPNSPDTTPALSRQATWTVESHSTENEEDPKLISLFVRAHEGIKSCNPYSIIPSQLVIPGYSHAIVTVRFTPLPADDVTEETDCIGYALGYMSVDDKARGTEGKVFCREAFEAETLHLDMTAQIKPALLSVECANDEGMRYRSAMSDLLKNGEPQKESLKVCCTTLSNNTKTPLTFKLMVNKPFLLVGLNPSTNSEGSTQAMETDMHTLKPRHNLMVKVAFKTNTEVLTDGRYFDEEEEIPQSGRKLEIHDDLIIQFNNTTTQKIPLHATLSVPEIELSKQSLDFGTCLVGQEREMEFIISNQTSSHSFWTTVIESKSQTCLEDTFRVVPSSGLLDAYITHVSNSKVLVRANFKAKHAENYEAVFLFQGSLGETSKRLYVRGQGSYDGKHEAILNI